MKNIQNISYLPIVKNLCDSYKDGIDRFLNGISDEFNKAVNLILETKGHVVVSGMGKSGHVGRKISATLASTGTPSFFLHPAEAIHGDLGMVKKDDTIILITYSGETEEIIKLLPSLKNLNTSVISLTGKADSTVSKFANTNIDVSIDREACPLNLAPTTSSMLTMSAGDAISVAVMHARGFAEEDFAITHPGGSLGKGLTESVSDNMITKNLPLLKDDQLISDAIIAMTESKLGLAVIHEHNILKGIITDGDLRRLLLSNKDISTIKVKEVMSVNPLTISKETLMIKAKSKMLESKVQALVVTNQKNLIQGIIQIY